MSYKNKKDPPPLSKTTLVGWLGLFERSIRNYSTAQDAISNGKITKGTSMSKK